MTNKQIAKAFSQLADLMELHQENPFKIKTYQSAYITLRKLDEPLSEMSLAQLAELKGVGKATAEKIQELLSTGTMSALQKYKDITPPGVVEMLQLSGFGPKKIYQIWKDLEITSLGELWYTCNENRLIELKGFGLKSQLEIKKQIEYLQKSRNKKLYADVEAAALELLQSMQETLPNARIEITGAMRRLSPTIERLEYLISNENGIQQLFDNQLLILEKQVENAYLAVTEKDELPITIFTCSLAEFGSKQFRYTASKGFMDFFISKNQGIDFKNIAEEKTLFAKANFPYVLPELREDIYQDFDKLSNIKLIDNQDIKGVVHTHTTYSDGIHSLTEMATHAKSLGYEYIAISDHSQTAFYANGLKPDRVVAQWEEIEKLQATLGNFRIFKSIESDINYDGSLDYQEDILKGFDLVIASVHAHLKMDEEKANARLIKAIENPYTTILGHPTGRLLLSREGYPIDHKKIIDACAANQVAIELNANPWRLDLDWTWIPYALDKGVWISINPDAHAKDGIKDIHYGVLAARKGSLTKENCLNALSATDFYTFCQKRKI
jgi:DNA polymerase (family 10)